MNNNADKRQNAGRNAGAPRETVGDCRRSIQERENMADGAAGGQAGAQGGPGACGGVKAKDPAKAAKDLASGVA